MENHREDEEVLEEAPIDWDNTEVLTITPDIVKSLVTDKIASETLDNDDTLIIRVRRPEGEGGRGGGEDTTLDQFFGDEEEELEESQ